MAAESDPRAATANVAVEKFLDIEELVADLENAVDDEDEWDDGKAFIAARDAAVALAACCRESKGLNWKKFCDAIASAMDDVPESANEVWRTIELLNTGWYDLD